MGLETIVESAVTLFIAEVRHALPQHSLSGLCTSHALNFVTDFEAIPRVQTVIRGEVGNVIASHTATLLNLLKRLASQHDERGCMGLQRMYL